jgi:uncharacterized membrane protein YphA (DoxX/SURF4 family)
VYRLFLVTLASALAGIPALVSAHEVYVLDFAAIADALNASSPNPFDAYAGNQYQFFFWGFITFVGFSTIFFMSVFHLFEERFDPLLFRLKKYAQPVARISFGLSLISCAYFGGLFGPELPLAALFRSYTWIATIVLYTSGILVTLGLFTRIGALVALCILIPASTHWGFYMFTYSNYLGEIFLALILGGGFLSVDKMRHGYPLPTFRKIAHMLEPYAFPILRVLFGISIVYAAFFAKFLHSNLALATIAEYDLVKYFQFEPLFIVLGAFIIESLIGIFFIIGLEIRWVTVFFLFWIFLSLLYFGESVWPHLILIGLNLTFFFHGYDRYSIEGYFLKRRLTEPVL